MADDVKITFRVDQEKKDRLDNLINVHNALVDQDEELTKSQIFRDCVDETIAEIESKLSQEGVSMEDFLEGNPKTAATAD